MEACPDTRPGLLDFKQVVAMGVGAMIGGGIFAVLGLAMSQAGHAAPLAFALGGVIAWLTGLSYAALGLRFRSDGGSFTYLERAFRHPNIGGLGGWLLLVGYIGTLGLYAYTFGSYGAALLGSPGASAMHHLLASLVVLAFLGINLYGVRETGTAELIIVTVKVLILALFAAIGLETLQVDRLLPVLDRGVGAMVMGAALIFVAYEGFELIPNAVNEMEDPERNLRRGILASIAITVVVYVGVSLVAVGHLTPEEVRRYGEYALAEAARPFLGRAGFVLIGVAAMFSTASAINATLFGTARLASAMATEDDLPAVFSLRRRQDNIPWASLILISGITLVFVNLADLTLISSFASSTFLLIFFAINLSAWRLRAHIGLRALWPALAMLLTLASWAALMAWLWRDDRQSLRWVWIFYAAVAVAELAFSQRRWIFSPPARRRGG